MSKLRRLLLAKHLNEINEDDIMMTADSNPEVMRCCYLAGFAKSPYFMTYKEAADVTDTAKFNAAFNNSDIVNFDEAKYFTGITGTVLFYASLLKDFSFLPNCNGYEINGSFPNCTVYNFEMGKSLLRRNGPETITNNNILKFLVDLNNYYWYIKDCHLGYGQCICKKGSDSVLWETPNPKNGIFIYPYEGGQSGLSVSMTFARFQGHTVVQNTSHYFGNAYMNNGGRNLKKIISFTGSSYYTTIPNYIGADVVNEEKFLIVPTWDPMDYENTTAYTTNFLNPNVCNFKLKRVNFGITIYNEKVLFKLNGFHEDEFFMTQEECAEITTLGNIFKNSDVEEFTELQYFTSLLNIDNAFYGCNKLKTVALPSHITTIGNNAFANCSSLTSITIPEGVTTIGNNAFANCSSLTSITIPSTVTYIGDNAFSGCVNISNIFMKSTTAPTLGENVWGDNESNYIGNNVNENKFVYIRDEYVGYDINKWNMLINILNFTKINFVFVEYIQSNGNEYFYLPSFNYQDCQIEFSVKYLLLTPDGNAFGAYNGNSRLETGFGWSGNNYSVNYGNAALQILNVKPNTNFNDFKINKSGVYINGQLSTFNYYYGNASQYGIFTNNLSLRFFGTDRGNNTQRITPICLKNWKCSKNGKILIELKPVICNEKIGMMDVISGNIYYNEGTGDFKYG